MPRAAQAPDAAAGGARAPTLDNRRARHDYEILERFEAGLVLCGTEVKSVRAGQVSLQQAHGRFRGGQLWLEGMTIQPYSHGNLFNHEPDRPRKLLLHTFEMRKIQARQAEKGLALIPLRLYFSKGRAKIELALCRGKQQGDKRETLKRRTAQRETQRAVANAVRRRA